MTYTQEQIRNFKYNAFKRGYSKSIFYYFILDEDSYPLPEQYDGILEDIIYYVKRFPSMFDGASYHDVGMFLYSLDKMSKRNRISRDMISEAFSMTLDKDIRGTRIFQYVTGVLRDWADYDGEEVVLEEVRTLV